MAKIVVTDKVNPIGPELLKGAGHEIVYLNSRSSEELAEKIKDCDGVLSRGLRITADMIKSAANLKIISKHGVGYDNIDIEAAKSQGVIVTITPGANSLAVAEHAFTLLMASAKHAFMVAQKYKTIGFEAKNSTEGVEITGKTLGVIGCGKIGSLVAKMAFGGFNMRVLVYDPYIEKTPEGTIRVDSLEGLLSQSDFVTLHTPLTSETRQIINANALKMMKPTAFLINSARGEVVDEAALISALKDGIIAGAGLDVVYPEPPAADHPLFFMENVILTPHFAPCTKETAANVSRISCENLIAYFSGKEPIGRII